MMALGDLRSQIMRPCRCGHLFGDHAACLPHPCVTFAAPDCPCRAFKSPPVPPEATGDAAATPPDKEMSGGAGCDMCDGKGVIEYEDPIIGGLVLATCPDCEVLR